VGLSDEQIAGASMGKTFAVSFVWAFLGAVVFSLFLGPEPGAGLAIGAGFSAGLFWIGGSFAISYRFEQRSGRLWMINAGYHLAQYTLYGIVLGLWP
jgi:hypothetical protein